MIRRHFEACFKIRNYDIFKAILFVFISVTREGLQLEKLRIEIQKLKLEKADLARQNNVSFRILKNLDSYLHYKCNKLFL